MADFRVFVAVVDQELAERDVAGFGGEVERGAGFVGDVVVAEERGLRGDYPGCKRYVFMEDCTPEANTGVYPRGIVSG